MMTDKSNQKAVIYSRTALMCDDHGQHARQEAICHAYASARNYEVTKIFRDAGSGSRTERVGINALMAYLHAHRAEAPVVIVESIDRLARSLVVHTTLLNMIHAAGGELESPSFQGGNEFSRVPA